MAIAEIFPYSDQHNLNLDWIITKIKEFSGNQISSIIVTQLDTDTIKFSATYTDGSTQDLGTVNLPQGPQGVQGETGATGATPELSIGTVSTLPAGSDASVTITGTAEAPVINMGIPQGVQGETGAAGGIINIDGYTGAVTTGDGIAFDTSTGALSSYDFNLTDTGTATVSNPSVTGVSGYYTSVSYALNADKSIGKIYGIISFAVSTSYASGNQALQFTTNIRVTAPATTYSIRAGIFQTFKVDTAGAGAVGNANIIIAADGTVTIGCTITNGCAGARYVIDLPACIYFFKDFGDTPDDNRNLRSLEFSERMAALNPIEDLER